MRESSGASPTEGDTKAVRAVYMFVMADMFARTGFRDFAELNFGKGGIFRIDRFADFVLKALGGPTRLEDLIFGRLFFYRHIFWF